MTSPPQLQLRDVTFAPPLFSRQQARQKTTRQGLTDPLDSAQLVLQGISCDIFQGDRVSIIGPSGAGKTSLLRLLNRLSEVTQGSICLEGQDIRQIPVLQLRQQVTLVLQESKLLGMTVREAIAYPLKLRQLPAQTIRDRLSTWTEHLHIPSEWLDRTELELSVGQRQLVALTRALAVQPKILLLDEPTAALDAGRGHTLLTVLTNLAATQGTTILMVNHQLDLAEQFCDRVLFLQQGKLVQDSPADQTDWPELRQRLLQAEAQEAQEWG
jgi:D-methionine transport system ATP-binding protein